MLVKEYCTLLGLKSTTATTRLLKVNTHPKAVRSWRKFGNTYDLVVDEKELAKIIERKIKKSK